MSSRTLATRSLGTIPLWVLFFTFVGSALLFLSRIQRLDLVFVTEEEIDGGNQHFGGERATGYEAHKPIRQISILGERNSGTRWTYDHLAECFGHNLTVVKQLTRYKHWFQYDDPTLYPHDTLVIAQFRNPYDWLRAMEHVPHHSPAHLPDVVGQEWKTFLTKPWTTERVGTDLWPNRTKHPTTTLCQQHFLYRDIVSCDIEPLPHEAYQHTIRYSEHQPFYEMRNDGSGQPYENILELRTDKIRNFLSTASYEGVADVWVVQYEYLVHKGTQHFIDRIAEWTGISPACKAKQAQVRIPKKSRIVPPDMAKHIRLHLNWTVEGWIGFEPELKREQIDWEWRT